MNSDQSPQLVDDAVSRVRSLLIEYVADKRRRAGGIDPAYVQLWDAIMALIEVGGKYIRPRIVIMAAQAYDSELTDDQIAPVAASVELLHIAMLVHDDIIDRDDMRYGIANITGQYMQLYEPYESELSERRHFANSAALLAGDALLSSAHHIMINARLSADIHHRLTDLLDEAIFHVIGGELIDTETSLRGQDSAPALVIAEQKTSCYSFYLPLLMGATIAGAPHADIERLQDIGREMGVIFQLRDDVLSVFADEQTLGKPVDSDIREGKRTYMVEQFYALADDDTKRQFERGFHNHQASDDDLAASRGALVSSGARAAVEREIDNRATRCRELIDQLSWHESSRQALDQLLTRCQTRSS